MAGLGWSVVRRTARRALRGSGDDLRSSLLAWWGRAYIRIYTRPPTISLTDQEPPLPFTIDTHAIAPGHIRVGSYLVILSPAGAHTVMHLCERRKAKPGEWGEYTRTLVPGSRNWVTMVRAAKDKIAPTYPVCARYRSLAAQMAAIDREPMPANPRALTTRYRCYAALHAELANLNAIAA